MMTFLSWNKIGIPIANIYNLVTFIEEFLHEAKFEISVNRLAFRADVPDLETFGIKDSFGSMILCVYLTKILQYIINIETKPVTDDNQPEVFTSAKLDELFKSRSDSYPVFDKAKHLLTGRFYHAERLAAELSNANFTFLVLVKIIAPFKSHKRIQQKKTDIFISNRAVEITLNESFIL